VGTGDIHRLHAHCPPAAHLRTSSPPAPLTLTVHSALGMTYTHFTRHNHLLAHRPKTLCRNFLGPAGTAGRLISEFWGARILPAVPGVTEHPNLLLLQLLALPLTCCHSLTSGPVPAHWESKGSLLLPAWAASLGRLSSAFQYCLRLTLSSQLCQCLPADASPGKQEAPHAQISALREEL